ncbi:TraR/DksA family transcriptional regulator [Aeromicrobium sp. SMF47]|uniref:TraR/DksA family transcriptional regulator n=1 Tax=Aeromicrobium TaxID=2040 RepID=UPI00129D8F61|nr:MULTISPECIES: TraR/DksA C4-type zinc finger protein [Aeromicrobium]MRJ78190.1 TraR/DksA family transcriptional regulator [Aeromicrobium yanjiei]MRK03179.1 TraR/DksA family transcriptional regulator [Aeromicrobium sp. S22]
MDARSRLEADRSSTRARLALLQQDVAGIIAASEGSNADDEHDPEGATIAFERSQVSALVAQAEKHLADIVEALERLDAGTYGVCTVCGRPIAHERLEARPVAVTCVACS